MQIPAGDIQLQRIFGGIQCGKLNIQPHGMSCLNAGFAAGGKKFFQALVFETFYHAFILCIVRLYISYGAVSNKAGRLKGSDGLLCLTPSAAVGIVGYNGRLKTR